MKNSARGRKRERKTIVAFEENLRDKTEKDSETNEMAEVAADSIRCLLPFE